MKFPIFLEKIANAQNELELRSYLMNNAGRLVGAKAWGLDLLDNGLQVAESELSGLPDTFKLHYRELGQNADELSQVMLQQHIPVHNLSHQTPKTWRQSKIYQNLLSRYGIEHGMVAPLVGNGRLIGGIYFLRGTDLPPFCDRDLIRVSSICLHLSVRLVTLRLSALNTNSVYINYLTKRELQIAQLVAQGLNNRAIAISLGISYNGVKQALKRMFLKVDVSARAELVAKLKI